MLILSTASSSSPFLCKSFQANITNKTQLTKPILINLFSMGNHMTKSPEISTLQLRTSQVVIPSQAPTSGDIEAKALSFDSLKRFIQCLVEMNQKVVKVIQKCKRDIFKNRELSELVEEYFGYSLQTICFVTALKDGLERAKYGHSLILDALEQFDDEESELDGNPYVKTLQELKKFKAAGNPFSDGFIEIFQSVFTKQTSMLAKLQIRKKKLDKKLKTIKAWRKVSSIIFSATAVALSICSIVVAAIATPHIAATALALAAATNAPLGSWIDSVWNKYEDAVEGQKVVAESMEERTHIVIKDLDDIRVVVEGLEIQIESLLHNVDFVVEEEAVKIGIEKIQKKMGVFMKNVEDLEVQADISIRDVQLARTEVLPWLIKAD
ncbi:hypothetical protein Vadar_033752 [Vaccinium darrowii]|uniref:Uncharacterized protein n=1 Tax=Vaccinium darrowii TaxID=229202 RepID=A0ACB7X6B8_9ERIC|nr:hypothetical protein Vadar_033752 [Vaccinium darrowii]